MPFDYAISKLPLLPLESYFAGRFLPIEFGVGAGPFIRPALIMSMPFALACVTIRAVWIGIRYRG